MSNLVITYEVVGKAQFDPDAGVGQFDKEFLTTSGVLTATVNQVTETDLAQPIAIAPKRRLVNQVTETDLAQPIGRIKLKVLGQNTETDSVQPIGRIKLKVLGQNTETDLAQSITRASTAHIIAVGQVAETDLAQPIGRIKLKVLGQNAEADLAQAFSRIKLKTLGQASETDLSQPIAWSPKRRLVAQAVEIDFAQSITAINGSGPVYTSGGMGLILRRRRGR